SGLADAAARRVRTYSGGMRRRLDVGAALVHRPPVLFLDEPTTGLDPEGRNELWEVIRELVADGTTVLLTTQYLEEADRLADRIVVIDKGWVIADDTPAALKSQLGSTITELGMSSGQEAERARAIVSGSAGGRAQPDRVPPCATAPGVLHDPAGDLRADVPLRLRWGDPAARQHALRRLPDAGHLRADGDVRLAGRSHRPGLRPQERAARTVPVAAYGPLGRAGGENLRRPGPQRVRRRAHGGRWLRRRVPDPQRS